MTDIDEHGRSHPPLVSDEVGMLVGFLDHQRSTLEWKCRGLDAAGLSSTIDSSSMTLGGILKHMALVEDVWFSVFLHGNPRCAPFGTVDWKADPDWEWESAAADTPEELRALWSSAVERSRVLMAEAVADGGLDRLAKRARHDGANHSLRWIMVHMIEEYARHNGHADILRESVDGETGE